MSTMTADAISANSSGESGDMLGWWRTGVIYQVYVRSFQDSDGDGVGDLGGVRARLPYLRSLGVDAIWLNPFYASPQHDHGYDVSDYMAVHHEYGDLATFDGLVRDAHRLDLKVIVDVVPNHCSIEHSWFTAAVAAGPGSPERQRFHFADGRGQYGELPPNNWRSIFGGPAWHRISEPDGTPGQWYLHTFAPEQADFNWDHPEVAEHFEEVLRFWLDRGVDGLRIDVAHGLHKSDGLPDHEFAIDDELTGDPVNPHAWNQPEVHDVWRSWRALAEEYTERTGRERVLVGEVGVLDTAELASYQRPGRAAPELLLRVPPSTMGRRVAVAGDRPRAGNGRGSRLPRGVGAQQPRHAPVRHAVRRWRTRRVRRRRRPRDHPSPRCRPADARAAGVGLPLPGRGTRSAGGGGPARCRADGPDVPPHRWRSPWAGRLPGPAALDARRRRVRLLAGRPHPALAASA